MNVFDEVGSSSNVVTIPVRYLFFLTVTLKLFFCFSLQKNTNALCVTIFISRFKKTRAFCKKNTYRVRLVIDRILKEKEQLPRLILDPFQSLLRAFYRGIPDNTRLSACNLRKMSSIVHFPCDNYQKLRIHIE